MDIETTKNQLISLVEKIKKEQPGTTLEFHQQKVTTKNMCVRGINGSLWIEPFQKWYDIGLSGKSLTKQMQGFMEELCGHKSGYKQTKPEPHHPYWRVYDFKYVEAAVYRYVKEPNSLKSEPPRVCRGLNSLRGFSNDRAKRYSPVERERAVRLVFDQQGQHSSQWSAIQLIASKVGCTAETLSRWVRQTETDQGKRSGMSNSDRG